MKNTFLTYLLALLFFVTLPANAATTITVTPTKTFQTIEGIGGGIVYYLDWLTTHKNKELLYDTLFNGLGLSALRMGNWAQEENADLTYDAEIYQAAKDRLGDKCLVQMSSWSAPASLKANGKLSGTNGGSQKATLKKENGSFVYDKYGQWWARAVGQYQKAGVYPNYISMQNEPDCDADYEATLFDGSTSSTIAHYGTALNYVAKYVNKLDSAPKILGPEVLGIGWNRVQDYVNYLNKDLISGYCFHYYHSGLNTHDARELRYSYPDDFLGAMTQLSTDYLNSKPMFMTENSSLVDYHQEMDPINTAIFLSYAFSVNHVASYTHWNLIWGDEGDGCINLEFSENGYKTDDGYVINGDYHALRHYSKFIQKGWINIDAQTTNSDVIVSAFKSPEGDAYTLVIVNRSSSAQYIKLPFFPEGTEATVIRSSIKDKVWSKTVGTYTTLSDLYPPAYSITTIAYRQRATKYVYNSDVSDFWTNTEKWTPSNMPKTSDTTYIQKGEVKASGISQSAPVFLEQEGTFRLVGNCSIDHFYLQGGDLKSYTSNALQTLQADMHVEKATTIIAGSIPTSTFQLCGRISGESDISKIGNGILDLHADASNFSGFWISNEGTLKVSYASAIGQNGIYILKDTLEIATDASTQNVWMTDSAAMKLNATFSVKFAQLGNEILAGGSYTSEDYPDFIKGEGKLIVDRPNPTLAKHGAGSSKQTISLGDSILNFSYSWENAETVSVIWNPEQPKGLTVNIDNQKQYVYFDGCPQMAGIYRYTVSTESETKNEAKKYGVISIADSSTVCTFDTNNHHTLAASAHYDNRTLSIQYDAKSMGVCHILLADMTGKVRIDTHREFSKGINHFSLNETIPQGAYLLQLRSQEGMKTIKLTINQ